MKLGRTIQLILAIALAHDGAGAQSVPLPQGGATAAEVVMGNVLLGGVTAGVRAAIARGDVPRAFLLGSVGGGVHVAGKFVSAGSGAGRTLGGRAVAAVGTSIVSNAGAGAGAFDEISVPVAMLRLRWRVHDSPRPAVSLNLHEATVAAYNAQRNGLVLDGDRTWRHGAIVLRTSNKEIRSHGKRVFGVAVSSTIVLDPTSPIADRVMRHELVHAEQMWFMQETWGRPAETFLRGAVPGFRWIPTWLEIGVVQLAARIGSSAFSGDPLRHLMETEAGFFERR